MVEGQIGTAGVGRWLIALPVAALAAWPAMALAGEGGGEPSLFAGSIWTSIWALVIFFTLLTVLGKFAWKPVVKMLQDREDKIASALAESERNRNDALGLLEKYRQQLAQSEAEAARLLAKTRTDAEKVSQQIVAQARTEAEDARKRAVEQINVSKDQAVAALFGEAATLATQVAGRILKREINPDEHRQLVQQTLDELAHKGV